MDVHGNVALRVLSSNDEQVLRNSLSALVSGQPGSLGEPLAIPMIKGMGKLYELLHFVRAQAKRGVLTEVPPMDAMARLAAVFRPLPLPAPEIAAILACTIVMGAIVTRLRLMWARRG